jgi:hypothetical protein
MMGFKVWRELFGNEEEGDAVYGMLLGMRGKEGVVPTGMEIRHGNTKEELNGFRAREGGLGGSRASWDRDTTEAPKSCRRGS